MPRGRRSPRLQYEFDRAHSTVATALLDALYPTSAPTEQSVEAAERRRLERKFYLSQQFVPATYLLSRCYSYATFKQQLAAGQDPKMALEHVSKRVGTLDLGIVTTFEDLEASQPVLWDTTYAAFSGGDVEAATTGAERPAGHAMRVAGTWDDLVKRAHERRDRYEQLFQTSAQFESTWRLAALGTAWFKQLDTDVALQLCLPAVRSE